MGDGIVGRLLIAPRQHPALAQASARDLQCDRLGDSIIVIRFMSTIESSTTQVTYMSVIVTPLTFLLAIWVWKWPSWQLLPVLVFMAFIATVGQFAYTKSFKYAEATALMPLDFTRQMWASLIGFLVFGEVPDIWSWIGGTVSFLNAVYITFHESTARAGKPAVSAV